MKFQKHSHQKPTHQEDSERESALTYIKNISTDAKRKYKIDIDHDPNKIQKHWMTHADRTEKEALLQHIFEYL